jgi:hypothetical protein
MKIIARSTILLLTLFLSSCLTCPKIKPRVSCDVSFQFDRCRCRCFDISKVKAVDSKLCGVDWNSDVKDFPLQSCEGIAGFYLEDIAIHIKPEALELKQCVEDTCKK